jgi:flagellar basal body rod protein FlgF
MATLYIASYSVERNFHPSESGYRYGADFRIDFAGAAYATIVLTVLWNEKKTLIPGTNRTTTTITGAGVSMSKSGAGWGAVADIPGEEAWIRYDNTVIRFRKRFTVELPLAPAASKIPVIGEIAKDLGATTTTRIEAEGYIDIVSYVENMQTTIY